MNNEITINGITYVRKDTIAKYNGKYVFKKGCRYFITSSGAPDKRMKVIQKMFPKKNVFFVGKNGYCGKVCLEVDIKDITVDFLEKLFSIDYFLIIDNEEKFMDMVNEEMSRSDIH